MANKTIDELAQELAGSEARSTLTSLFEEGSFTELSPYIGGSVITGTGVVEGKQVCAFIQDSAVNSGAVCKTAAQKLAKLYQLAVKNGSPVIGIYDSKGGAVKEGVELLKAYSDIAASSASLSGVAPQIAVVTGVCGGIHASLACMSDFVIMTEKAEFFLNPPFISEDKTKGAGTAENAALSGIAALVVKDNAEALKKAKELIAILPQNNLEVAGNDYFAVSDIAADGSMKGEALVKAIADKDSLVELYGKFGEVSYTALGSINWKTVGFVATDKAEGRLAKEDCAKIAKFVSICDAFSIPVVTFVNNEGFALDSKAELSGSVRDCAKLTQVYASATTAKIAVVTGNALGGIFTAFCGNNSDMTIAYENAVIAPVAPQTAAVFLHGEDCNNNEELQKAAEDYAENEASALNAMEHGVVDKIVPAEELWSALNNAVEALSSKRVSTPARKHINFIY